ncbi:protein Hook homolog 2 isoform X2 [Leptonychotes weddellii]|uniref:Protein Hook homolog 2 isoform X2 n=1 Tax=Leptonychotes weddellii TaxID=9713 RepID=A0A2U3XGM6_LEPWE|nr:protein Hook homolog 2 isoform X2 [Leptonychotes weddellii]
MVGPRHMASVSGLAHRSLQPGRCTLASWEGCGHQWEEGKEAQWSARCCPSSVHRQKLHEADLELQRKREYIEELEPPADSGTRRIEELQHSLQKKDADLRAMEERYRRYVDKARTVIQTLEPKQRPSGGAPPELHTLRTQLWERDVRIRHLEMDFEKSRSQREQEEKLLISAWYNMGMALQQRAGEERAPAHAQSFLAQQRLATNTRRGPLGRLASLNMRPTDKH